jgi:hypothetical protein
MNASSFNFHRAKTVEHKKIRCIGEGRGSCEDMVLALVARKATVILDHGKPQTFRYLVTKVPRSGPRGCLLLRVDAELRLQ